MHRTQLIQHAIDTLSAGTYLEIGVYDGQTFSVVRVTRKIGVDPIAPWPNVEAALKRPGAQYFATTSDEFFERHAAEQLPLGVDVVFIDGLHTYDQTYRDVCNALNVLRPGGVILVHDCRRPAQLQAILRKLRKTRTLDVWAVEQLAKAEAARKGQVKRFKRRQTA